MTKKIKQPTEMPLQRETKITHSFSYSKGTVALNFSLQGKKELEDFSECLLIAQRDIALVLQGLKEESKN